jgi:hypothetical protein
MSNRAFAVWCAVAVIVAAAAFSLALSGWPCIGWYGC